MGIEVRPDGSRALSSFPLVVPAVVGSALSLLSLASMPSGYYNFSRFAITAMAVWVLTGCHGRDRIGWTVAFGAVAVLYNPLLPAYMTRESWVPFDLLAGALFIVVGFLVKEHEEIAPAASEVVAEIPAEVQRARTDENTDPVAPTPRHISQEQTPETVQITTAGWFYLGVKPLPGNLTVMGGGLWFDPAYQVGEPRGQMLQRWPIPLSEVIAARISFPEGLALNMPHTVHTTTSADAYIHLLLHTPGTSVEFAMGVDQVGTAALLWETVRQLEKQQHGHPIYPWL